MAPNLSFLEAPIVPSEGQVALAITILRSKPVDVAVRGQDYRF